MVRAWYMDEDNTNPKNEHHRQPPKFIALEELYKISGVEYYEVNLNNLEADETLKKIIEEKKTVEQLVVENLTETDLLKFYTEHFHTDDELRLTIDGCGYYDFRDKFEEWVRVEVLPGDLLVIPGGCYHRFTVDKNNNYKGIKLMPNGVYQAHNRPADDMNCRKVYLRKLHNNAFSPSSNGDVNVLV